MNTYTAKKVSKPGSTPVYEYRDHRIVNSAGSRWGRGWVYVTGSETHFSTTIESAKFFIDLWIEEGRA